MKLFVLLITVVGNDLIIYSFFTVGKNEYYIHREQNAEQVARALVQGFIHNPAR